MYFSLRCCTVVIATTLTHLGIGTKGCDRKLFTGYWKREKKRTQLGLTGKKMCLQSAVSPVQANWTVYLTVFLFTASLCEALPWWWGESLLDNTGDLDVVLTGTFYDKKINQLTYTLTLTLQAWVCVNLNAVKQGPPS